MSDENLNPNQNTEQNSEKLQEISEMYNPQIQSQSTTGSAEVLPEMSPIGYYVRAFQKYVQFSGRATRAEYWWFYLVTIAVSILLSIIDMILNTPLEFISLIYLIVSLIPSTSIQVRRLHDISKSGWYVLLNLIIIIGWIWLLILNILDSTPGDNKYGPNPKGIKA
jgi:uncharacterized membrane protein YhaH (DUF805 family)